MFVNFTYLDYDMQLTRGHPKISYFCLLSEEFKARPQFLLVKMVQERSVFEISNKKLQSLWICRVEENWVVGFFSRKGFLN